MKHKVINAKILGGAIREQRKKLGLTQKALGEKVTMDQATISVIESGNPGTKLETLLHILSALGLELTVSTKNNIEKKKTSWQ